MAAFVAEFRHLSEYCESLEDMICDHLVCSVVSSSIQCHLLAEQILMSNAQPGLSDGNCREERKGPARTEAVPYKHCGTHSYTQTEANGAQDRHREPFSLVRREATTATMSFQDQRMSQTRILS